MILAEQWGTPSIEKNSSEDLTRISLAILQNILDNSHKKYAAFRRVLRKLSFHFLHKDEKPNILEFNAVALVNRFVNFQQRFQDKEKAIGAFLTTVDDDIHSWVNEFLRKARVDTFTIVVDPRTGRMTNDSYEQFDDDLLTMMETNERFLAKQGEKTDRAHADTLSVRALFDWAMHANAGNTCLSISPRYEKSSEELEEDPYEFVFFRKITEKSPEKIVIETTQYKTWLSLDNMVLILQLAGFHPPVRWKNSSENIAMIVQPLTTTLSEEDIAPLLNSLSLYAENQLMDTQFIPNQQALEKSLKTARDFLITTIRDTLLSLKGEQRGEVSTASRIIEEAVNFSMRYMKASRDKLAFGKTHDVHHEKLASSFAQYVEVRHFGKKVTAAEADAIMTNVSTSLGGIVQHMVSATQCYGSMFEQLSLNGTSIQAPKLPFAGLGNVRPENASLLKDPMNCPHCKKSVLVWKHEGNRVQCSWCGKFKACGENEALGETYPQVTPNISLERGSLPIKQAIQEQPFTHTIPHERKTDPGLWFLGFFAPKYILQET